MPEFKYIKDFAAKHPDRWQNIMAAEKLTHENIQAITGLFEGYPPLSSADADFVVFGSIARNECTIGSDVDWTLLIDGQVSDQHADSVKIIGKLLEKGEFAKHGTSGMFGQISFSHDLVHYIGGEDDTNHNISRRILLLLESEKMCIGGESNQSGTAHERVKKAILKEYIQHDSGFSSVSKQNARVPRFLLNDIIRFWRTMCVDFAYKQKQQDGHKWGLRNIKLRMSRKLIYLKGLLMCYSCYRHDEITKDNIAQHLFDLSQLTPLDVMIKVLSDEIPESTLIGLLNGYDHFLGTLNDKGIRETLESLKMTDAYKNEVFLAEREMAHKFQELLSDTFETEKSGNLKEFTKNYLIF